MFNTKKIKNIENRIKEIKEIEDRQQSFIDYATRILQSVQSNDKKRYMYELQMKDIELIEDGKKMRKIRKMIN